MELLASHQKMTISLPTCCPDRRLRSLLQLGLMLAPMFLAGCTGWGDEEFICQGQDRVSTHLNTGAEALETLQTRPLTIDLHLRGAEVMVKTFRANLVSEDSATSIRFSAAGPSASIAGRFDKESRTLTYQEERILVIDRQEQTIRTSGVYTCKPAGG